MIIRTHAAQKPAPAQPEPVKKEIYRAPKKSIPLPVEEKKVEDPTPSYSGLAPEVEESED